MKKIIVGITAADGVRLGLRLMELLKEQPQVETHLVISAKAQECFRYECGIDCAQVRALADYSYDVDNTAAAISSGSFETDGMIIAPCSMKSLAAIANGYSDNLLTRAADVCLKERRKLVLLARETPLSLIHIRNMLTVTEAGAVVLPPMLTFYNSPKSMEDQIDHVLSKALMQFSLTPREFKPWQGVN